jgi:hypothetical protein
MGGNDKQRGKTLGRVLGSALLPLAMTALAAGCPGVLEDPDRFLDAGTSFACPDIPGELFPKSCGGMICHEGDKAAGGLDLVAPNVEARLIDKKARDCPGILLDPIVPEASLIYTKLLPLPACGSPMPLGRPAFTLEERDCVRDWIAEQTPTGPEDDGGNMEDAGDAGDAAPE